MAQPPNTILSGFDQYPDDAYASVKDCCLIAGISTATAYRAMKRGDFPPVTELSVGRSGIQLRHLRRYLANPPAYRSESIGAGLDEAGDAVPSQAYSKKSGGRTNGK